MVNYSAAQLNKTFSAMGHSIRRGILARLALGEATVAELAEPFRVSAPAISKHLRVLEKAGLMVRRKKGREHYCRLHAETLQRAENWMEQQRQQWEQRLDRLDRYLTELQAKEKNHGRDKK